MGIQVRGDNVLVEARTDKMSQTKQGLYVVQDDTEKKTMVTRVLAVGPDVRTVQPGDMVVIPYFAGTEWQGSIFVPESEILAHEPDPQEG